MSRCGLVVPQKRPDLVYKTRPNGGQAGPDDYLPEQAAPVPRGEGMPQVQLHSRNGRVVLARAALCVGLAAAAICTNTAVRAGDDDEGIGFMDGRLDDMGYRCTSGDQYLVSGIGLPAAIHFTLLRAPKHLAMSSRLIQSD